MPNAAILKTPAMKTKTQNPSRIPSLVIALCAFFAATAAFAQPVNGVWTNTISSTWSDVLSWTNGVYANGAGSIADFSQVAIPSNTTITVTLDVGITNDIALFGDTTNNPGNWTIADTGIPWTLDSKTSPFATINVNLKTGAANNVAAWSTATIAAAITGTNIIVKTGPSPLILSAAAGNTFGSGMYISNGMVQATLNPSSLGTGPVTLYTGSWLRLQNAAIPGNNPSTTPTESAFPNAIVIPAGQTGMMTLSPRAFPAITGTVTGSGTFNLWADYVRDNLGGDWSGFSGQLNVSASTRGNSDFRMDPTFNAPAGWANTKLAFVSNGINADVLNWYNAGTPGTNFVIGELSAVTPGIVTLMAASTSAGGQNGNSPPFTITVGGLNTSTEFAGNFAAPGVANGVGLIKVGTGTLTLDGPTIENNGMMVVSNGVLQLGKGGTTGKLGRTAVVTNYATLAFNRSDTLTVSNVITGTGTLQQMGPGSLVLAPSGGGTNTYTGETEVTGGLLAPVAESALGPNPGSFTAGQLTLNGGGLRATNNLAINNPNRGITVGAAGGSLSPDANTTLTIASTIGGAGNLTVSGAGTADLTGANDYTGKTILSSGTLAIGAEAALGTAPGSPTADQLTLNGGTLRGTSSLAVSSANRGITVNATGGTLSPDATTTMTISEPIVGSGNLQIAGAGTVVLNGADSSTGNTLVNQGTLAIGASGSISSPVISVASGANLDVSAGTFTPASGQSITGNGNVIGTLNAGSGVVLNPAGPGVIGHLSFANGLSLGGGAILGADISSASNDTYGITGDLSLSGANTLQVNVLGILSAGDYPIVNFGTISGGGTLSLAGFPDSRLTPVISTNASGHSIDLVLTGSAASLIWAGGLNGNAWDVDTTKNWLNGANPDVFLAGDSVTFNDSGSANSSVNLVGSLQAGSVTVSSSAGYTFGGSGQIASPASLLVSGSGTLTVLTTNSYNGGTTISSGTVQVGNGTAAGSLGSGGITDNSALNYNVPGTQTVANQISGSGSVGVQGGTIVLTANNSYGSTSISGGATVQVGNGTAAGTLGTGGIGDNGALIFNRTGAVTNNSSISGSGSLTVQGANDVVALGANNSYLGATLVNAGVLQVGTGGTSGTVGSSSSVTLTNGGGLAFNRSDMLTNQVAILGTNGVLIQDGPGTLVITNDYNNLGSTKVNGGILQVGDGVDPSGTLTGPITITAPATLLFNRPDAISISNVMGGTGNLTITGPTNVTILSTNSALSGTVTISNTTVFLGNEANSDVYETAINQGALGSGTITFVGNSFLRLSGSTIPNGDPNGGNGSGTIGNVINIPAGQTGTMWAPGRYTLNATFTGSGTFNLGVQYVRGDTTANWTNFDGQLNVITNAAQGTAPGSYDFRMSSATGIPNAKVFLADDVSMYSRAAANAFIPLGELTGGTNSSVRSTTGGGTSAGVNENWVVGGLNTTATYYGTLTDGNTFIKVGTGTWTLAGVNSFGGGLFVSNGVVTLSGDGLTTGVLLDATGVTVADSGIIDPSGLPDDILHVGDGGVGQSSAQTLAGNGTVKDGAYIASLGTLSPGFSSNVFGNITITSNLLVDGIIQMKVDHLLSAVSDLVTASNIIISPVAASATLTVTQVDTNYLQTGDVFRLFSKPITGHGFATVSLPTTSPDGLITYTWQDKTAVDGTLVLLSGGPVSNPVNTHPTNLVFGVSAGQLTLSWPSDHTGWRLEAQTNALNAGLQPASNAWVTVPGSSATNMVTVPVSTANGTVFYRLVYP